MSSESTLSPAFSTSAVSIRAATTNDIQACTELDASYTTTYVWQMQLRQQERSINITFDCVRLPRPMSVSLPSANKNLSQDSSQASFIYTACYAQEVIGYMQGDISPDGHQFILHQLLIHQAVRRQGLGNMLLRAARRIALHHHCHQIKLMLQTKNDPAIQFAQQAGFVYAGYDEKFYHNGDIALIFSLTL